MRPRRLGRTSSSCWRWYLIARHGDCCTQPVVTGTQRSPLPTYNPGAASAPCHPPVFSSLHRIGPAAQFRWRTARIPITWLLRSGRFSGIEKQPAMPNETVRGSVNCSQSTRKLATECGDYRGLRSRGFLPGGGCRLFELVEGGMALALVYSGDDVVHGGPMAVYGANHQGRTVERLSRVPVAVA